MNFKEPLVNFLKCVLNNINSAFSHRIDQLQLQLLRETNILRVLNRGIERLFSENPRTHSVSRIVVEKDVGCRIGRYVEGSKYELVESRAKEIQIYYERMVFEITQELKGDKRVFALIANLSQSYSAERKEIRNVKVHGGRPCNENEFQVIPIRFKPINLERRARLIRKKKTIN
ncbi:BBM_1a_G0015330.mRNA.1.CDS.1 [Saccharomyces cerevisiae]|nr:BBM_1a_G0015330.mRNA.1.CDS.1 [Saccharomyces cerevisiae]CAI7102164.1 BBM_1a_G0015330.mRNA.1.CDS.1 [Saccharomyces cerevisiae]